MTYCVETDIEDPLLGVAKVCIPPRPSDVEDPSLGVTDGGIIWRGLSSQGSLVDLDRAVNINMKARASFMVFNSPTLI